MASNHWTSLECDPGLFTELIEQLGVKGVQVEEMFGLDEESFQAISPAFGLLFLFKWVAAEEVNTRGGEAATRSNSNRALDEIPHPPPDLFFAKQVITNACGTQALLSILLNSDQVVDIGSGLAQFKEFTRDFDAELKGYTLGESELIRESHNAFARPEPFVLNEFGAGRDDARGRRRHAGEEEGDDNAYHFIAYLPFKGGIYELDGLNPSGPILLERFNEGEEDWLQRVRHHIEARIARYDSSEIHFNLMALIRDKRLVLEGEALEFEIQRREEWKRENVRRRHNYIPFIVAALRLLAARNELPALVQRAREREQKQ